MMIKKVVILNQEDYDYVFDKLIEIDKMVTRMKDENPSYGMSELGRQLSMALDVFVGENGD